MEQKVLRMLAENARMSIEEMAARAGTDKATIAAVLADLEKNQIVQGYVALINEEKLPERKVKALIEVRVTPRRDGGFDEVARRLAKFDEVVNLSLVSGSFDLLLEVEGDSLQEVAGFVSEKLATIDGVMSCNTSFQLKKYKESGRMLLEEEEYERLKICP